nr:hypothetical protein [uncultured Rhodopila sp.]
MTVTIDLRPDVEVVGAIRAPRLEEKVPEPAALFAADRAALWRESAKGLPHTPPLSDEPISRESIYDTRG